MLLSDDYKLLLNQVKTSFNSVTKLCCCASTVVDLRNKCSDRSMEVKLSTLLGNYDRPTDQPTNQPKDRTTNQETDGEGS